MTTGRLKRLRRTLTALWAALSLAAIALLAVVAIRAVDAREREALDRSVETRALAAHDWAFEDERRQNVLFVDTTTAESPFSPRSLAAARGERPGLLAVDARGRVVAGVGGEGEHAAEAIDRAGDGETRTYTSTAAGEGLRVANVPIQGESGVIGTVVALAPTAEASDDTLQTGLLISAAALVLWAAAVAAGWALTGRALGPAIGVATREEAFLADSAHELRTPVAVIRARAEQALREEDPGPEVHGALTAIVGAAENASRTVADMLELARLDAGRGITERTPLRLDLLALAVADEVETEAERAGVRVEVESGDPVVVEGDERLLTRAVANLVENAIRHGGVGGLVTVAVTVDGGTAKVTVSDRGPGVPPAQRDRIFDRFHRASRTAAPGAGLGLPIVKLVAQAHDGDLELAPAAFEATGATFVLTLPATGSGTASPGSA